MKGFFRVDGTFFTVAGKIADMVIVTVMWLIGCIPVVTILTSTASLYHTTVKCIRYDRGNVRREFREAYKKNLKQGIELTLLYGGVGTLLVCADYRIFFVSQNKTGAMFIPAFWLFALTALYAVNVLWLIPVFSRLANTLGNILRLNFVVTVRYLFRGVAVLLLYAAAVVCIRASAPFLLLFPSLVMLLSSYLSEPVLHRYMPKLEADNGDWRYGFR